MSEKSSVKAARIAEAEREAKQRKKYKITVITICALVVLLIIFVALFGSNLFYNTTTAVDIGGYEYTVADFNYYYVGAYNTYYSNLYNAFYGYGITDSSGSMLNGMLPDTSKPLSEQTFPGSTQTWEEYLEQTAIEDMKSTAMLCTEAEKAGFTAPEDELALAEESINTMKTQADSLGYPNLDSYLARIYGKGMTEEVMRRNVDRDVLASAYAAHVRESQEFTTQQLKDYYAQHADENDILVYRTYFFSGAAVEDDADTAEDETVSAEDALAQAEVGAKALKAASTGEQEFIDAVSAMRAGDESYNADEATLSHVSASNLADMYKEWLLSADRKTGDVEIFPSAANSDSESTATPGFYVVFFLERSKNEYHGVSGYYGLVALADDNVPEDTADRDAYVRQLTELNASTVMNGYTGGSEKGYDAFVKVMTDNSDLLATSGAVDRMGIYDNMPQVVIDWFHDPQRKEGDTDTLYDPENGCFLVYFSSDDGVYADLMADDQLRSEGYTAWQTEKMAAFATVDKQWEMGLAKKVPALGG